jgi:hypothetical protein
LWFVLWVRKQALVHPLRRCAGVHVDNGYAEHIAVLVGIWQYDDPGDVRGVLFDDIDDNFKPDDQRLR